MTGVQTCALPILRRDGLWFGVFDRLGGRCGCGGFGRCGHGFGDGFPGWRRMGNRCFFDGCGGFGAGFKRNGLLFRGPGFERSRFFHRFDFDRSFPGRHGFFCAGFDSDFGFRALRDFLGHGKSSVQAPQGWMALQAVVKALGGTDDYTLVDFPDFRLFFSPSSSANRRLSSPESRPCCSIAVSAAISDSSS